MKNRVQLITENPMLGGYTLAVRDDWSYKIKYVNINEQEKTEYEKVYGEEMITYDEFFEWWSRFNRVGKYAN